MDVTDLGGWCDMGVDGNGGEPGYLLDALHGKMCSRIATKDKYCISFLAFEQLN